MYPTKARGPKAWYSNLRRFMWLAPVCTDKESGPKSAFVLAGEVATKYWLSLLKINKLASWPDINTIGCPKKLVLKMDPFFWRRFLTNGESCKNLRISPIRGKPKMLRGNAICDRSEERR